MNLYIGYLNEKYSIVLTKFSLLTLSFLIWRNLLNSSLPSTTGLADTKPSFSKLDLRSSKSSLSLWVDRNILASANNLSTSVKNVSWISSTILFISVLSKGAFEEYTTLLPTLSTCLSLVNNLLTVPNIFFYLLYYLLYYI